VSEKNNRIKWLHIRLSDAEYKKLHAGFHSSTKQKISSYARNILLGKPITVYTRSKSIDDFVTEMILLRNELKAIGNNINQVVRKLHTADNDAELKFWSKQIEKIKELLFSKIDEINSNIARISDQWLQE
jgi:hypothetical protein